MNNGIIQQDDITLDDDLEEVDDYDYDDKPIDYNQLMQQVHFLGDISFKTIIESIKVQFDDYINMEDTANYVNVFYEQLANSYKALCDNEGEDYPHEVKVCLDKIYDVFTDNILHLFETRLFISINDAENSNREDLQFMIQRAYEYFILNAKNNFKTVIASSINGMIEDGLDDDAYFNQVQTLMELFSPLIQKVTPVEFIQLTGDKEIYDLFTNNQIIGNFLRKYTPKLYQNEVFSMEIINYTTMIRLFEEDMKLNLSSQEN
jgi:hypothetical protein